MCVCVAQVRNLLVSERERLFAGLKTIPFLEPYPSHSNFVLAKVVGGKDAKQVKEQLAQEHGIMVRTDTYTHIMARTGRVCRIIRGCAHCQAQTWGALMCVCVCVCVCVQVRHYAKAGLSNYIRVSVGKPEHTDAVIGALKAMA